jgi:hypothetical protein
MEPADKQDPSIPEAASVAGEDLDQDGLPKYPTKEDLLPKRQHKLPRMNAVQRRRYHESMLKILRSVGVIATSQPFEAHALHMLKWPDGSGEQIYLHELMDQCNKILNYQNALEKGECRSIQYKMDVAWSLTVEEWFKTQKKQPIPAIVKQHMEHKQNPKSAKTYSGKMYANV